MTDLSEPLSALMSRIAGPGALSDLSRLSGGANMESWAFEWGEAERTASYVLRRAPSAEYMADRPFGHADEAALVVAAFDAGVKAPEVVGVLEAGDGLGTGYVMRRVMGEVSPATILADPPPSLLRSEEHTSELQSLMRISYAVFCLKKKKQITTDLE